jgi:hypothetical protein
VRDFCGPGWTATVEIVDFNAYIEGLGEQSGNGIDQQPDQIFK